MSLSFRSTQVSAPSTSPTLSVGGTGHFIRHRRVNLDGDVTLWSDASECSSAPVTITPESYSDTTQLLRDEFLYSSDDITYYIIPRTNETGDQLVTAFDTGSWTIAVDGDTQNSALTNLNFGTFTTSSSPFKRLYLLNEGLNVGSLTFNFIDAITTEVASDYSGLIRVEIEGVFSQFSQAESTAYNDSFLWQSPPRNLNTLGLILPSNSFVKLKVTLVNFPVGSLIQNTVSLSMQVQENLTVFPLSYDSDWALNTFLYDPEKGFDYPFIEASNSGLTVTIKPFLINVNGVLVGRFVDTTFTLSVTANYELTISSTGVLQIWNTATEIVPDNVLLIASITTDALAPFLTFHELKISPRPGTYVYDDEILSSFIGKILAYNAGLSEVGVSVDGTDAVGVSLSLTKSYGTSGFALVQTFDNTIVKGDYLGCFSGNAIKDVNGFLEAVKDEYFGFVLVKIRFNKPPTLGLITADDVTVDTTGFVVSTSTNLQTHLEQTDQALRKEISTGVSEGGEVTVSVDELTVTVSEGSGEIDDRSTTPGTTLYYDVSWSTTAGLSPAGNGLNWVYVDNTSTIVIDQTPPTPELIRKRCYLARLSVTGGLITGKTNVIVLTQQSAVNLKELGDQVGLQRSQPDELLLSTISTTLNVRITTGSFFFLSINHPSVTDTNYLTIPEFDSSGSDTFQHRLPNGTSLGDTSVLDVGFYAPGGVRTAIPGAGSRVGIYYGWVFPGGANVRFTYGANWYDTAANAREALDDLKAIASAPPSFDNAFLLGAYIVRKDATNLDAATIVQTNKSGSFSGGSVAAVGGIVTLNSAYQNSPAPNEITTTALNGSVDIQIGSGADTDAAFKVKNTAGSTVFQVTGEGATSVNSLTINGVNSEAFTTNEQTKLGTLTGSNVIINGGFQYDPINNGAAQTITAAATKATIAPPFYAYCTGANVTWQRVAGSAQSKYRGQFTGAVGVTGVQCGQRLYSEDSYHINGQTCTLSVDLANSLLTTVTWTAYYANTDNAFGTIASPTRTLIASGTFTVSSAIARYSTQIAIPSAATTGIEVVFSVGAQTSGTWTIGDVQLELGAIATDFNESNKSKASDQFEVINGGGLFDTNSTAGMAFVATNIAGLNPVSSVFFRIKKKIPAISFPTGAGNVRYVSSSGITSSLTPAAYSIKKNAFTLSANTTPSAGAGWLDNVGDIIISAVL